MTLLMIVALVVMSAGATMVLWIFDDLRNTTTDNLLFEGLKVGMIGLAIVAVVHFLLTMKAKS